MLFLLFELDGDRYALDSTQIAEVLALHPLKAIPGAPRWVAGLFAYHGQPVPVIDVPQLALGRPARQLRSTRLVIVHYSGVLREPAASTHAAHDLAHAKGPLLGLIVEHATQARRIEREHFAASGLATPHARWLGPVAHDDAGFVQRVEVQQMLDDEVKALLFSAATLTDDQGATQ
jgi:chemotaxis-related protein WspB